MQELFNNGWMIMLILTVVLSLTHIVLNKDIIKFSFPFKSLPLTLVAVIFFWIPIYLFNADANLLVLTIPYLLGVLFVMIFQCLSPRSETFMAFLAFLFFLLIYKIAPENMLFILTVFSVGSFSGIVLRLLRAEKFSGNLLSAMCVMLPIYVGYEWLNNLQLTSIDLSKRTFLIFVVAMLALTYNFAINFIKEDEKGLKRFGALVLAALVINLVFTNFLALSVNYIYFVVAGFVFAQILDIIDKKQHKDNKTLVFESFTGLGLILLVGFIATRIFGVWGLVLLSLCCLTTVSSCSEKLLNWPVIASLFFGTKALVHIFIEQTTLNVTGLNLNHPYVYVGLIIGLTIPFILMAVTVSYRAKFVGFNLLTLFVFALIVPITASYLIHAEASGAMILSLSVSALIASVFGKFIGEFLDNQATKIISNAMLPLASLMGIMVIATNTLIEMGNIASRETRAVTFVTATVITFIVALALYKVEDKEEDDLCTEKST